MIFHPEYEDKSLFDPIDARGEPVVSMSVIQTGSIALLGFFLGDYISAIWPLGEYSSGIYAIAAIKGAIAYAFIYWHYQPKRNHCQ